MKSKYGDFKRALDFVLKWEGEETSDTGGLTKYGISQKSFPTLDIQNLTIKDAELLYYKHYWLKGKCDKLSWPLSGILFDSAVNIGIQGATKILQKAVNAVITRYLKDKIPKIKEDGILGPKTEKAIWILSEYEVVDLLAYEIGLKRIRYYCNLASREEYGKYLRGWINRVLDLLASLYL